MSITHRTLLAVMSRCAVAQTRIASGAGTLSFTTLWQIGKADSNEMTQWQDTLPRRSLTLYSTYQLEREMPGVIVE
jgi:hypothetical protein